MDIEIGSNLYKNFNGTIEVEGVPQLQVARHPSTGALLVNFALFDSNGRMLAKMVDSALMFNERRAYELAKTDKHLLMKAVDSGKVVLQLDVKDPQVVLLAQGEFHTMKGHLLQVTATAWKIEKQHKSGLIHDSQGGVVSIG
ncbi:MAG: hypothetical protein JSR29_17730 [Nitrospira sp.]|nr:hypothetical protein [Nitrospira sp.]